MKILFYGINGQGLGHISRLLNVARVLKELANGLGVKAELIFLTTSEASDIASEFPVFKIPSLEVYRDHNYNTRDYQVDGRFMVNNLFATLRPDAVVVDTIPTGAFGEFSLIRDFCEKRVFINRHVNSSGEPDKSRVSAFKLYDLIITPDDADNSNKYHFSDSAEAQKNVFTGTIHGFRSDKALNKADVRTYFSIPNNKKLVYISAGGGGDISADRQIELIIDTLNERDDLVFLIGYGPLYKGRVRYASNIITFTGPNVRDYFRGLDAAICAAGYNTFHELLAAKVPTIFYAQKKGLDRQDLRVLDGKNKAWNDYFVEFPDCAMLEQKLDDILNGTCIEVVNLQSRRASLGTLNASVAMMKMFIGSGHPNLSEHTIYLTAEAYKHWSNCEALVSQYKFVDLWNWALFLGPMSIQNWHELVEGAPHRFIKESQDVGMIMLGLLRTAATTLDIRLGFTGTPISAIKHALTLFYRNQNHNELNLENIATYIE